MVMTRIASNLKHRLCDSRWMPWLGRCGFVGRGLVYVVVGAFIVYAALTTEAAKGWRGAFLALRDLPGGIPAVLVLTVALGTFIAWRLAESLLDPESIGNDVKGLALRGVYLVSAGVYTALAWKALTVLLGTSSSSDDGKTQHATALAMSAPLGRWLVLVVGIVVVIVALVQISRSVTLDVHKRLGRAGSELSTWIAVLGRIGLLCRGLVFAIIGGFFIYAAWFYAPGKARAMSGALRAIAAQPFGAWLLGAIGVGLIAFGLFCLAIARYRRFTCGSA